MDKKVIKMAVYTSETCHLKLDIKTINMSLFLRGGVFRCKTSTSAKKYMACKVSIRAKLDVIESNETCLFLN